VGTNASARLHRDVLVQSGARYLIVLEGINDIGFPGTATADEIIAGHRQIIDRAHAMGLKVQGLWRYSHALLGVPGRDLLHRRWRGKAPGDKPMANAPNGWLTVIICATIARADRTPASIFSYPINAISRRVRAFGAGPANAMRTVR
jgi:lysophospholipase L1-like esterase